MVGDPLADLIVRLKNAQSVSQKKVRVIFSKQLFNIGAILKRLGYLSEIETISEGRKKFLLITLNPDKPFEVLKRVSKPGARIYLGYKELYPPLSGRGLAIISTPQGIMTHVQAKRRKLGGEYLMIVA
jgi:small subunit ribosomal protein S8